MISVCIATFNGEKYISEQLSSILGQLSFNDEIIITDDSSTDNTIKIIKSFNDTRIKIFENQKFHNPTFNFECAIKKSKGEFIFLADQDDFWYPNKVESMVHKLKDYDLVVSDCHIGDENLNIIRKSHFEWRKSKTGFVKNLYKNSYLGCCMAFKRDILKRALPFPSYIPMFDTWIGLICDIYYKPYFFPKQLMIYRRHDSNVTKITANYKSTSTLISKFVNRFYFIIAILNRILLIK